MHIFVTMYVSPEVRGVRERHALMLLRQCRSAHVFCDMSPCVRAKNILILLAQVALFDTSK